MVRRVPCVVGAEHDGDWNIDDVEREVPLTHRNEGVTWHGRHESIVLKHLRAPDGRALRGTPVSIAMALRTRLP